MADTTTVPAAPDLYIRVGDEYRLVVAWRVFTDASWAADAITPHGRFDVAETDGVYELRDGEYAPVSAPRGSA